MCYKCSKDRRTPSRLKSHFVRTHGEDWSDTYFDKSFVREELRKNGMPVDSTLLDAPETDAEMPAAQGGDPTPSREGPFRPPERLIIELADAVDAEAEPQPRPLSPSRDVPIPPIPGSAYPPPDVLRARARDQLPRGKGKRDRRGSGALPHGKPPASSTRPRSVVHVPEASTSRKKQERRNREYFRQWASRRSREIRGWDDQTRRKKVLEDRRHRRRNDRIARELSARTGGPQMMRIHTWRSEPRAFREPLGSPFEHHPVLSDVTDDELDLTKEEEPLPFDFA